ncbi:MAG: hypothetical protein IPM98_21320 [Lewinellaceae bacterium]|nr:hypothetical protein [Lewinellaceae bacterium]
MQQAQLRINTALLALVFLMSLTLKTGHLLLLHHDHQDIPTCEAGHDSHTAHLHDERYNPDDCSICAFLFATPELTAHLIRPEVPGRVFSQVLSSLDVSHHLSAPYATQLRGPPACFPCC